jgi:HD-GYP domain-containing protein (c-di-GMP phosphodiesterase class II)
MATLISESEKSPVEYTLGEHTWIGRQKTNTVQIDDKLVSSEHCLIYLDSARGYVLKDLKSRNGTFVNEKRVDNEEVLLSGHRIRIGDTVWIFRDAALSPGSMVEVDDLTSQSHIHTTISPPQQKQFLPEKKIRSDAALRADYEKLRVTYELQRDISLHENIDVILERILDRTFEFLHYDHAVVLLADSGGQLRSRAYKSRKSGEKFVISSTVVEHVRREKKGIISSDAKVDERFKMSQSLILRGIRSTMAAPILSSEQLLGILIIDSTASANAFTEKDLHLITSIANQTAQMLSNSLLHEELRLSFERSIRTLAAMVDARHPFTAGHSERVTVYATLIADAMKCGEEQMQVLYFAALLHDIGKIGIPDTVLLKNGRFTPEEQAAMKMHPAKTRSILEKFHFPRLLDQVPSVAASHHEKMDGTGYPDGLACERIPQLSRILAVADVFDALSSKRDYPKYAESEIYSNDAMPLEKVIDIIRKESGCAFDSQVVEAFMKILPQALLRFRGTHFGTEYVDEIIREIAPELLPGA